MSVTEIQNQLNDIWNGQMGENWVETQPLTDETLRSTEACLVDTVRERNPIRILDAGCGNGTTTAAMAEALPESGTATGINLSKAMIGNARRVWGNNHRNLSFIASDAASYDFGDSRCDHVTTRFGTMFFADQHAAFSHLRRSATDDASLYLIVWRGPEENPFLTAGPRIADSVIGTTPPGNPGAPGPFAMSDPEEVRIMLSESGWRNITLTALDLEFSFSAADIETFMTKLAPLGPAVADADAATLTRIHNQVRAEYDSAIQGDRLRYTAACWAIAGTAS